MQFRPGRLRYRILEKNSVLNGKNKLRKRPEEGSFRRKRTLPRNACRCMERIQGFVKSMETYG